jgi:MinD-like ATPase involved in chromosome partitioning or flagellar assembly
VTIVAVVGDVCTTTTVAIASAWPTADDDVLIVEADPAGGDLAAWFDVPIAPSLSTVVTRITDASWSELGRFVRTAGNGVRLVPAPARALEANQAVGEAARTFVPSLAAVRSPVAIVDTGTAQATPSMHPFVGAAAVTVVVHRQSTQSARAAAVRLQRFADTLDSFASVAANVVVAVVGAVPFSLDEIQAFLAGSVGTTPVVGLPVDPLTAGVYAGRTGVSPRRLARLPLARASRDLAVTVARAIDHQTGGLWRVPT